MNYKKKPIAIGLAAVAGVVLLFGWYQHRTAGDKPFTHTGVVNPEKAAAGLTTKPAPELSTVTFDPPPSMGVGSYTDPAVAKSAASKESPKKESQRR